MILRHLFQRSLAHASYLIGCGASGEALIVDPNRDLQQYLDLAEREGLRIAAIVETHIHADFVSGAPELAARTGARLYLSGAGGADWQYANATATRLHDGDALMLGTIRCDVWHVPGHTPEHIALLVTDTAAADAPMGMISGDFVFVGDVGRPDLLEKAVGVANTSDGAARQLFGSLQRFKTLPDWLQVWPAHGAGSPCGKALGAVPQTTVGYERRFNPALVIDDEDAFVRFILADQPAPPLAFRQIKHRNQYGAATEPNAGSIQQLAAADLRGVLADKTVLVDTRSAAEFAHGHVRGAINLPITQSMLTWAGWTLPYDRPLALLAADQCAAVEVAHTLRLIGLDNVIGFWTPAALDQAEPLATINRVDIAAFAALREAGTTVLDVRRHDEYRNGHLAGSQHIPLQELHTRWAEIALDRPLAIHCQSGVRSALVASLLTGRTEQPIYDLVGGYSAWNAAGREVEQ